MVDFGQKADASVGKNEPRYQSKYHERSGSVYVVDTLRSNRTVLTVNMNNGVDPAKLIAAQCANALNREAT